MFLTKRYFVYILFKAKVRGNYSKIYMILYHTHYNIIYMYNCYFFLAQEKRWADFPNVTFTFDCTDRPIGFYADVEFDCMIFHLCDEDGRRIPYMCGNETSFNQKFRVCDWNYNVDCAASPDWYYLNDLTYRTDPPATSDNDY